MRHGGGAGAAQEPDKLYETTYSGKYLLLRLRVSAPEPYEDSLASTEGCRPSLIH